MKSNKGRCPKCERTVTNVIAEQVTIGKGTTSQWEGISYSCESCHAVLSVTMDQVLLTDLIAEKVAKKLGR